MNLKTLVRRSLTRAGIRIPDALLDRATRPMRQLGMTLGPDDVVIDLGAHIGDATVEFAYRAGHVYAFEPNPANFARLQARTAKLPNVTIFNQAVSDSNGTTRLYFETPKPGKFYEGATIMGGKSNVSYTQYVDVETVSIVDVIDRIGKPITFIKMDIEGAEYRVIEALVSSGRIAQVGKVYYECHVDRIAELVPEKERVLELARAAGVFDKLDLNWQ